MSRSLSSSFYSWPFPFALACMASLQVAFFPRTLKVCKVKVMKHQFLNKGIHCSKCVSIVDCFSILWNLCDRLKFSYLREETFNTFPTKLNPKTVVHNWWFSSLCGFLIVSSKDIVTLSISSFSKFCIGWAEGFVQRLLIKVSDAFSAIKVFGILTI